MFPVNRAMANPLTIPAPRSKSAFIDQLGGVYEHSPWVAEIYSEARWEELKDGEPLDAERLADAMAEIVDAADRETKLALLRAHPDLAGRLAQADGLTASSSKEQKGAGLDRCTPEEFEAFTTLNADYVTKNGFPFIVAVAGLNRGDILAQFRARIANDTKTEFATALREVHKIARNRILQIAKDLAS